MTKATIHSLFALLILLSAAGCGRIHFTPAVSPDACPAEQTQDQRLSIDSCPDDTFPPGTLPRDPEMSPRYHYLTFLMLHRENRIDDAMAALENAITLAPDASFLKRDQIMMYLSMDQEETALALAESLVAEYPDELENLLLLARLKKDDTLEKKTHPLLKRILELDPDNRETYLRLGRIYMENQQIPEALELFSRMAEQLPDYYVAHFYLGEAHFLAGNHKEAAQEFEATINLEPDLIEPRLRLVDVLQDPDNPAGNPDPDPLLAMYEQILDIEPENKQALLETARLYHQTGQTDLAAKQFMALGDQARHDNHLLMTAVDLYLSQKRYEDAVTVFSGMLAADPDSDNFNFFLGLAYESSEHPEQAIEHYLKVSPAHPQYKKTLLTIAFLYREIGQTQKAVSFMEQHYQQAPDDIDFITYLAAFYENENQLEKAMTLLSKGLENAPENTTLLFRLGAVQDKAGLKNKSIATMKEIIRLDPEHASALNYLGYTYADLKIHLDEAEALIIKALEIKPDDGYILDSMGWVYFQQGKFDKAVGYLERAAELTDYEAIIAAHLADAYLKTGQNLKALKTFHKVLANAKESDKTLVLEVTEKIRTLEQQIQTPDMQNSDTVTP